MHAFLINSDNSQNINQEITKIINKKKYDIFEYQIKNIDDVRYLIKYLNLKLTQPTVIVIRKLDLASKEALNALLKLSEEPQELVKIVATCSNINLLPQTIISRFQIISPKESVNVNFSKVEGFLKSSISEKFTYFDKSTDRDTAIESLKEIQNYCQKMIEGKKRLTYISELADITQDALIKIKANGNLNLQLTNFIVNLSRL